MLKSLAALCVILTLTSGIGRCADDIMDGERKAFKEELQKIRKKSSKKEVGEKLALKKALYARSLFSTLNGNGKDPNTKKWSAEYGQLLKEIAGHGKAGATVIYMGPSFPSAWTTVPGDGIIRLTKQATMPEEYDIKVLLDFLNYGWVYGGDAPKFDKTTLNIRGKKAGKDGYFTKNDSIGRDFAYLFYFQSNMEMSVKFQISISKGDKIKDVYVNLKKVSGKGKYKATMREGNNLILVIFSNKKKTDMKLQLKVEPGKAAKKKKSREKKDKKEEPKLETAEFYAE